MKNYLTALFICVAMVFVAVGATFAIDNTEQAPAEEVTLSAAAAPQAVKCVGNCVKYDAFGMVDAGLTNLFTYLKAVEDAQVKEYLDAMHAIAVANSRPRSNYHPGSTVGECTGFAIPDYIIEAESGGNPSAYNPSGAYGCAQTLLSHYSSGQCQGLDPYTIDGQRECVNRLSNGGTNLDPWAATR